MIQILLSSAHSFGFCFRILLCPSRDPVGSLIWILVVVVFGSDGSSEPSPPAPPAPSDPICFSPVILPSSAVNAACEEIQDTLTILNGEGTVDISYYFPNVKIVSGSTSISVQGENRLVSLIWGEVAGHPGPVRVEGAYCSWILNIRIRIFQDCFTDLIRPHRPWQ